MFYKKQVYDDTLGGLWWGSIHVISGNIDEHCNWTDIEQFTAASSIPMMNEHKSLSYRNNMIFML